MSSSGVLATIDGAAMGTCSLRLEDTGTWGTAWVQFEFLPPYDIGMGTISLSMDLLFPAIENYYFKIREKYTAASSFGEVWFEKTGRIGMIDANGSAGNSRRGSRWQAEPSACGLMKALLKQDVGMPVPGENPIRRDSQPVHAASRLPNPRSLT